LERKNPPEAVSKREIRGDRKDGRGTPEKLFPGALDRAAFGMGEYEYNIFFRETEEDQDDGREKWQTLWFELRMREIYWEGAQRCRHQGGKEKKKELASTVVGDDKRYLKIGPRLG